MTKLIVPLSTNINMNINIRCLLLSALHAMLVAGVHDICICIFGVHANTSKLILASS